MRKPVASDRHREEEITTLFRHVFTTSEGEKEGEPIGHLAAELAAGIDDEDILGYGTYVDGCLVGSLFFTRLRVVDPIRIYMLAPMAVETRHQEKGIGKALINFALEDLRRRSPAACLREGIRQPRLLVSRGQPITSAPGWGFPAAPDRA